MSPEGLTPRSRAACCRASDNAGGSRTEIFWDMPASGDRRARRRGVRPAGPGQDVRVAPRRGTDIRADDAGGDVELPGELRLDPATGEASKFTQASQDGPLPDPRPQLADRIDFRRRPALLAQVSSQLTGADHVNVRHFFLLAWLSDKRAHTSFIGLRSRRGARRVAPCPSG